MKFFHISDLHLGIKLRGRSLIEDQRHILKQIVERAAEENIDAIVIVGDIYDRSVPPAEAVELFDGFITDLLSNVDNICIMVISGNHDSQERLNIFRNILQKDNVYMIGMPPSGPDDYIEKVTFNYNEGIYNFYLLPYIMPHMVKNVLGIERDRTISYNDAVHALIERENINNSEINILVSHQFYNTVGSNPENVKRTDSEYITVGNIDEVNSDILEKFDYAALGHIHTPSTVGNPNYRYCGSPLGYSMSERDQEKSIVCVNVENDGVKEISLIPLSPLRTVRRINGTLEEILNQACNDYIEAEVIDNEDAHNKADVKNMLRDAFPYLLNIRWVKPETTVSHVDSDIDNIISENEVDPFTLCKMFLGDINDDEEKLLMEVINELNGNGEGGNE